MIIIKTTVLSAFFFCLAFYFKWKYFVLIKRILSETVCLFCFCDLFSNIYSKIKFTAINWSYLCNFYSKVIFFFFGIFVWKSSYYFSLVNLNYWYFTTILWKFQKNRTNGTCWKSAIKLPTYRLLHNLRSFLVWENVKIFDFLDN